MYYNIYVCNIKEKRSAFMLNRIKVVICGKEYTLKTNEQSTYIYNLAKNLEKRISDTSFETGASSYNAAIMVALSTLDEITRASNTVDDIRNQTKEYVDMAGKLRIEKDAALKEIEFLKNKVEQLEATLKLKILKEKI